MKSARGIVLQTFALSETSLVVAWLTDGPEGLIRTVAKGARRARSPWRGQLELGVAGELSWVESRRSELHTLREVAVEERLLGRGGGYAELLLAGYFSRALLSAVEEGQEVGELHDLLQRALRFTAREGAQWRALRHFERELCRLTGHGQSAGQVASYRGSLGGRLEALRRRCEQEFGEREGLF